MEGQELIEKVNWLVYYAEKRELNADEKALVQKRIDRIKQEIQFEKNEIIRLERALAENTPTSEEQLAATAVSVNKVAVCPRCRSNEVAVKPVTYDCYECGATWQTER